MVMSIRIQATQPVAFTQAGFRRGVIAALPFILSNGVSGIVIGVAYRGLGLDLATSIFFSTAVYSATAQAVTLSMLAASPSLAGMIIACVATNARYLLMGAHLRQLFNEVPRRVMLPVLFSLADASWFMTVAESERARPDPGYLLGCGVPMILGWIGGTALGHFLPIEPKGPIALAAQFLPLGFIVMLLPTQWRGRSSLMPWFASAVVALVVATTLGPNWAMILGGGAGTLMCVLRGEDV
jgi:predicted branched-subunit amino acid permease